MGLSRTTAFARRRRKRGPLAAARHAVGPKGPLRNAKGPLGAKGPLRGGKQPQRALGRPSWKLIGLAGLAGVAATGAAVARSRRAHSELEPDELRERLRERLAAAGQADEPTAPTA